MASRTGLFPAAIHTITKAQESSHRSGTGNKNNNPKAVVGKKTKQFLNAASNFEVSTVPKGPHPTCEACSAKKTSFHSPANARNAFLKRKSELGFLTGQKVKQFDVIKRSQSNENLAEISTHDAVPRSILKKVDLRVQETQRHVQFNHKATDQASLRAKLNNWLKERGKTPGSCHNLLKFGANLSAMKRKSLSDVTSKLNVKENSQPKDALKYRKNLFGTETEQVENQNVHHNQNEESAPNIEPNNVEVPDEISQHSNKENLKEQLQSMLDECLNLFHDGCSLEIVLPWLANMETSIPDVVTFAPYYVCKAKVLGEFPQMVLDVYSEAVRNNAQPSSLLADEMKAALSRWLRPSTKSAETASTGQAATDGPAVDEKTSCAAPLDEIKETPLKTRPASVVKEGSTVKYKVTTPHRQSNLAVVTPVRRSVRLSGKQATPGRKSDVVERIVQISPNERRSMVFKMNPSVLGEVDISERFNSLAMQ